jgi:ABC-2 type transport system ATP-binding protein
MLLDLLRPDSGYISVDKKKWGNRLPEFRASLGYLPEERGLYKKDRAIDVLVYFGQLKGLSTLEAKSRVKKYLEDFELSEHAESPLESFSKGMSQKVQLIMTLLHSPELVVLDEPFSGLDPVNVRLVRTVVRDLSARGALVILCTHRMDEAERLCGDILMLKKGKIALYGSQRELRESQGGGQISMQSGISVEMLESVERTEVRGDLQDIILKSGVSSGEFLHQLSAQGISVTELHITPISLEELYVRAAKEA